MMDDKLLGLVEYRKNKAFETIDEIKILLKNLINSTKIAAQHFQVCENRN